MEAKSSIVLEHKVNDHVYQFIMPIGASYGEAYDVAMMCGAEVWKMADEARRKASSDKEEASAS
jgi:hypothetical protein